MCFFCLFFLLFFFFSFFPEKQDHAKYLDIFHLEIYFWHFMQIVSDNLHEMSKVNLAIPRKTHDHKTQPSQDPRKGMDGLKHIIKQT